MFILLRIRWGDWHVGARCHWPFLLHGCDTPLILSVVKVAYSERSCAKLWAKLAVRCTKVFSFKSFGLCSPRTSFVVLEAWPCPRRSSRTPHEGLGLGLGLEWQGLALERKVLALSLPKPRLFPKTQTTLLLKKPVKMDGYCNEKLALRVSHHYCCSHTPPMQLMSCR